MRPAIQFSCRITVLMLAVLWLCQTPLSAAIYKWKDDQGKIHFTDDKSRIPLKYRGQLEKFKGVVEPSQGKSGASAAPDAGSDEEAAMGEETPSAGGGEQASKPPPKSKYTKKQIALLKKVKANMTKIWAGNVKLVKHIKPTKVNGKYYLASQRKAASQKKGMIKQIGASEIPTLKEVKKFLKRSSVNDTKLKMGNPPFMEKVQKIRQTIEAEIPIQKGFIEQLKKDLGAEDKPPPNDPDAYIPPKDSGIYSKKPKASPRLESNDLMDLVGN
ncbi:MAG: DUF4124 domain-containing protein [Nitrospinae bacterium]|nr:DUF4124 domain-containing protein [Nitrospinota bacterium]